MKIAIDVTPAALLGGPRDGVYRYLTELLCGFDKIDDCNQYTLFFNFMRPGHIRAVKNYCAQFKKIKYQRKISFIPPNLRINFNFPIEMFVGKVDVFHSPAHLLPKVSSAKAIVTIHDLAFLKMAGLSEGDQREFSGYIGFEEKRQRSYKMREQFFRRLKKNISRTIHSADVIIAVSNFTKDEILKNFNVNENKIRIIHNGVSDRFKPIHDEQALMRIKQRYGIKGHFILHVGALDPNHNLIKLLEAFKELTVSLGGKYSLVMAGSINWFYKCLLRKVRELRLENDVIFTGFVPDEDLPIVYSAAELCVMPSAVEGFGFPIVEAMACGVPVVAACAGSLPEVVGNAGILVEHYSPKKIAEGMCKILTDTELSLRLKEIGQERARAFSWENTSRKTLEAYREAVSL